MTVPFFSVFTPTHKPGYLGECFASLLDQTEADWEWILVPNGGGTVPPEIALHPKVRVVAAPDYMTRQGIGALKRFACEQCAGEYLVELDHDDWLLPHALKRLREEILKSSAGFLYSDFTNCFDDGRCEVYNATYGWENYSVELPGRQATAMRAFATDPSALSAILYAPNHVRVWSREAYFMAGGHDPLLSVCDDYDLVCRTNLAGIAFHHIPECLYVYRLQTGGENTYLQRNQEIQIKQQEVANTYFYQIVEQWCKNQKLPMLDLGGAHGCPPGYTSVDIADADICCDIRQGLPFPDSSVGCIRAYDFLEHIPHCSSVDCDHGVGKKGLCTVGLMNELYRVLVPGGLVLSRTPSTDGRGAFQDPTHASFWNPNSFWYYTRSEQARYLRGMVARFQANRVWQTYPSAWHEQNRILYVHADLVALKGQRQPGLCEI